MPSGGIWGGHRWGNLKWPSGFLAMDTSVLTILPLHGPPKESKLWCGEGLKGLQPYIRVVCAAKPLPMMAIRGRGSDLGDVLKVLGKSRNILNPV